MKVYQRVSVKVEVTDASRNKNAQRSSGSETPEVVFIYPASPVGRTDEGKYTTLQRDLVGYQALKYPEYLEVRDSPIFPPHSGLPTRSGLLPHSRLPPRPGLPPIPGSSMGRLEDGGYTLPRRGSGIYEEIPDDLVGEDVYEPGYVHSVSQSDRNHESPDGDHKSPDPPDSPHLKMKRESYVTVPLTAEPH